MYSLLLTTAPWATPRLVTAKRCTSSTSRSKTSMFLPVIGVTSLMRSSAARRFSSITAMPGLRRRASSAWSPSAASQT